MRYCTRCLYPANHPLHLTFDEQGVCSGCRVHEEKDRLPWDERAQKLERIFDQFRDRTGHHYDCIVPVSGARDSYFIVHTVKNVFGMNPLLVAYNKHYNTDRGIRNLAHLRTLFNCDFLAMTVQPQKVKRVTRASLRRLGSMYWHCLAGQTAFPVQTAVRFKVPLIVWGVHQGCDQVGMFSHLDEVEMTRKYRKEHDLMGVEAEDLLEGDPELTPEDVLPFCYPHDKELESVGVRGIYLSNYLRWDSKAQHESMIKAHGYESWPQAGTFDTYNDVDSFHYSGLHDYIKFLKWGYGKVTDHASREIRLGRLTREEGIRLVRRYRHQSPPADTKLFLRWLGMDAESLWSWVDRFRDPSIWQKGPEGGWELMDSVLNHEDDPGVDGVRLQRHEGCEFQVSPSRRPGHVEEYYVLIGKGYVSSASLF